MEMISLRELPAQCCPGLNDAHEANHARRQVGTLQRTGSIHRFLGAPRRLANPSQDRIIFLEKRAARQTSTGKVCRPSGGGPSSGTFRHIPAAEDASPVRFPPNHDRSNPESEAKKTQVKSIHTLLMLSRWHEGCTPPNSPAKRYPERNGRIPETAGARLRELEAE